LYLALLARYLPKVLTKISATGMVEAALAPLQIKGGSPCEYILTPDKEQFLAAIDKECLRKEITN
jgi:hypothetical protein